MKLAKLSLAALLVAGLANATSLESVVKGTEVSGFVQLQENWGFDGSNTDMGDYFYRVHSEIAVTDTVSAHVGIDNTVVSSTANLEQVALVYTGIANTKIIAGEHPLMTEFTDTSRSFSAGDLAVQNGFGVTAVTSVDGINLAAALFSKSDAGADSLQYVHADTNVADLFDISAGFLQVDGGDSYANVALDSVIAASDDLDINVGASFSAKDPEVGSTNSLVAAYAGATISGFDVELAYGKTGNNGGSVNLSNDAANAFGLQDVYLTGADSDAWKLTVGADVSENIGVSAGYLMGENAAGDSITEGKLAVDYAIADNFVAQAYVNSYDYENTALSGTNLKVQLRYTY